MSALIDTNIAIHLRDGDPAVLERFATLPAPPAISIVTQVELEGGIAARPDLAAKRRAACDALLAELAILDFDAACAAAYRRILEQTAYSRPRILDRMIAATALAHDLRLITMNWCDFKDVPGLALEVWESPG